MLKRERINRKIYPTKEAAQLDVFNYIEIFYNTKRQDGFNGGLQPAKYERQHFNEAGRRLVN